MNEFIKKLAADKILFWSDSLAGVLMILSFCWVLIVYRNLPPFMPLFNQMAWGEDRLGQKPEFFLPIFIVFSVLMINMFFSYALYEKTPLISRMLAITSFLLSLLVFIFTVRTTQLLL